jgi:hypothetical protein
MGHGGHALRGKRTKEYLMDSASRVWVRPGEVAAMLGVSRDSVLYLPIERIDVRGSGKSRPQWRYRRAGVEAFIATRTEHAVADASSV